MDTNKQNILHFFARYIKTELGIVYSDHNFFQLQNRLEDIAKQLSIGSLEQLYQKAQSGIIGQFRQLLLDTATNNETSFFRDPNVFLSIQTAMIDRLLAVRTNPSETIQIWSGASSYGQEAVSVAIMLKEWQEKSGQRFNFRIIGTDISDRALTKAKSGSYTKLEIGRGLSQDIIRKYFVEAGDLFSVRTDIRACMEFKTQNLLEPFIFGDKFHLVFLRNVLIYQDVEGKKNILKRVASAMHKGAFLLMGSGESLTYQLINK